MKSFVTPLAVFLLGAAGQAPVITAVSPVRNAVAAPRASNVAVTFDQPMAAASVGAVRVFSAQRGGLLMGAALEIARGA